MSQPTDRRFILIMSGKGGVGKSTIAANIARSIALVEGTAGMLDLDLTGPSIPTIFGIQKEKVGKDEEGHMIPVLKDNVEVLSLGLMLNDQSDPIIWRGPRKHSMIIQFFQLMKCKSKTIVIDMPPGTSDEHMSTIQILKENNIKFTSIIVSTPSQLAIADVRKELDFLKQAQSPILGVIENFSGVMCPCCSKINQLLGPSALDSLVQEFTLKSLAKIPFMPSTAAHTDKGEMDEAFLTLFKPIADAVVEWISQI